MKKLTFTLIAIYLFSIVPIILYSQTPEKIDFQAAARYDSGDPIFNQEISVQITIIKGPLGPQQEDIYVERHYTETDDYGLFTLAIGAGDDTITGVFADLDWSYGKYWTKVEIDAEGGNNYTPMGSMEMVSVPYALYARNTDSWTNTNDTTYTMNKVGIGTNSPEAKLEVRDGETILEQESWIAPTLINGWENYGGGYSYAGYFKDSNGVVHLRGLIRYGEEDVAIFSLPAGYRPAYKMIFAAHTYGSPNTGRIDIEPEGDVIMNSGNNNWISLDGITFRAQ